VWIYSPAFSDTEAAKRFMVANLRGVRDYNDAIVHGRDKASVVDILTRHIPVKDASLYDQMQFPALDPNGQVMLDRLDADVQYYVSKGFMPQSIDAQQVVDRRFVDYALGRLGPYRPPQ
jgi:NitT/TauT family transport system substrate-binding protein